MQTPGRSLHLAPARRSSRRAAAVLLALPCALAGAAQVGTLTGDPHARGVQARDLQAAAAAAGASGFTPVEIREFATRLQAAVRADDAARVAALVAFPLRLNRPGAAPQRVRRGEFLRRYGEIFTPRLRAAVLAQDPGALFENWQGVMFGAGEAWAGGAYPAKRGARGELRLTVVNVAP